MPKQYLTGKTTTSCASPLCNKCHEYHSCAKQSYWIANSTSKPFVFAKWADCSLKRDSDGAYACLHSRMFAVLGPDVCAGDWCRVANCVRFLVWIAAFHHIGWIHKAVTMVCIPYAVWSLRNSFNSPAICPMFNCYPASIYTSVSHPPACHFFSSSFFMLKMFTTAVFTKNY